ncbi:MAG TPA: hypothetical protein VFG92_04310 [Agromyces sp.]|nr:hypothetical protein [Agromyces sp.]
MRRITPFFATMIVASWLFIIGFAIGFESELAGNPALPNAHSDAALTGLTAGLATLGAALVIAVGVRLTQVVRAQRTSSTRTAG